MGTELSLCFIFMNNVLNVTSVWTEWSGVGIPTGMRELCLLQQCPYRLWGSLNVAFDGTWGTIARVMNRPPVVGHIHLSAKLSFSGIIPLFALHVFVAIRRGNSLVIWWSRMDKLSFLIKFLVFVNKEYQLHVSFSHSTKYVRGPPPAPAPPPPHPPSTRILLLSANFYKYGDTLYIVTYFTLREKFLSPQAAFTAFCITCTVLPLEMHGKWQLEILERSIHLGDLWVCQMMPLK
jgi:hypothetical protein